MKLKVESQAPAEICDLIHKSFVNVETNGLKFLLGQIYCLEIITEHILEFA